MKEIDNLVKTLKIHFSSIQNQTYLRNSKIVMEDCLKGLHKVFNFNLCSNNLLKIKNISFANINLLFSKNLLFQKKNYS